MIISRLTYYFIFLIALSQLAFAQLPIMQIVGNAQKVNNEIVSRRDTNGRFCAAIQIKSSIDGLAFSSYSGIVGDIDHKPGRDMVYLQPDERVLEVYATGYEPFKIILSEYGIHLKPKEIWEIIVTGDKINDEIPINIIVKPDGASITIDHEPSSTGRQFSVVEGDHKLIIEKSGYQSLKETIKVDLTNTYFEYTLEEVEDVDISIETTPSGAHVYIDNLKLGFTPISDYFPPGKYPIKITKDWYIILEDSINIQSPKTIKTYTLQPNFGKITVSSSPQTDLNVIINDIDQNVKTSHIFDKQKTGIYKISAKSPTYETNEIQFQLDQGQHKKVELISVQIFSTLKVSSTPQDGLEIYINGISQEEVTPHTFENYIPGNYSIEARSDRYTTKISNVELMKGETKNIELVSEPIFSTIVIDSVPEKGLEIYFNNIFQNEVTPFTFENLMPGNYSIEAKSELYTTNNINIKLLKGELKEVRLISQKNFATLTINTLSRSIVFLNNNEITQLKNIQLEPMRVTVKVTHNKAPNLIKTISLRKGENYILDLYSIVKKGTIQIVVTPLDATIELNGDAEEYFYNNGKKIFKDIPVGTYQLTVTKDGFVTHNDTLTLTIGRKIKHNVHLKESNSENLVIPSYINTFESSSLSQKMVFVKGGTFEMGNINWDERSRNEKPSHAVTVDDFYIGKYEVTQKQWKEIMGSNPSHFIGENLPVESVSWNDVQDFIQKLNKKTGMEYRLPTEAEWEYAARGISADTDTKWSGTNNEDELANYSWYSFNNIPSGSKDVGSKLPNANGLYDMSGNVWEWCSDWYNEYQSPAKSTNQRSKSGSYRSLRGGSWGIDQYHLRCLYRLNYYPTYKNSYIGFRLVSTP